MGGTWTHVLLDTNNPMDLFARGGGGARPADLVVGSRGTAHGGWHPGSENLKPAPPPPLVGSGTHRPRTVHLFYSDNLPNTIVNFFLGFRLR